MEWLKNLVQNATNPSDGATAVIERPPELIQRQDGATAEPPSKYTVLLHNDDTTFPEFVKLVICEAFGLPAPQAMQKMMQAHMQGQSKIETFTKDEAETRLASAKVKIDEAVLWQDHGNEDGDCQLQFTLVPESK